MLRSRRSMVPLCIVLASMPVASALLPGSRASAIAQVDAGEYSLLQTGTVGWVRVSSDRTVEWWAYIDGAYEWADPGSTGQNRWRLDAEYIGDGDFVSYAAWKTDVLERPEALGQTIVFQIHAVSEETAGD